MDDQSSGACAEVGNGYILHLGPSAGWLFATLSRPYWLIFLFPIGWAFTVHFALHLIWAGWGVYGFARRVLWLSPGAAFLSALFALPAKMVAHLGGGHVDTIAAVAWLPWLWWAVDEVGAAGFGGTGEPGRPVHGVCTERGGLSVLSPDDLFTVYAQRIEDD